MACRNEVAGSNKFLLPKNSISAQHTFPKSLEYFAKIHKKSLLDSSQNVCDSKNREVIIVKLEKLSLSSCNLLKIPHEIFNLKYLTDLNLSNNFITELPNEMENLPNLISLNLSGNKLICLPKSFIYLYQLVCLNLSHNFFFEIPDILYFGLKNIKILDLSYNKIRNFKNSPKCSNKLVELKLSSNMLGSWPDWIFNSTCQLHLLDLSGNPMKLGRPPMINYYNSEISQTLKILNIENCNFKHKELHFFTYFKNIEILKLGNQEPKLLFSGKNDLRGLNMDVFKRCVNLKKLFLNNSLISFLPANFDSIRNIEFLFLNENLLSWLPETFCQIIHLKVLNLSSNLILFLPKDIGSLQYLEEIYLQDNKISQLPDSFGELVNLKFIDLYNNKLEKIDLNILEKKSLQGIDLEQNRLDFNLINSDITTNEIKEKYHSLKQTYREIFGCKSRADGQTLETDLNIELSSPTRTFNLECTEYFEDDNFSSSERSSPGEHQEIALNIDDDWEEMNFSNTEDDFFDPNDVKHNDIALVKLKSFEFFNNFCPANSHVEPIGKTYLKIAKSNSQNEPVEGQFDSD